MEKNVEAVLDNLRQEFIEQSQDMLAEIDGLIARLADGGGDGALLELRRHVHTIKGQGGTFGFPLITRIAHMLEDYLETLPELNATALGGIQVYADTIAEMLEKGEPGSGNAAGALLAALPAARPAGFTDQIVKDLRALVVMPRGVQRKIIGQELVGCGFRLSFADSAVSALEAALAFPPHIVFASMEIAEFSGGELAAVFQSVQTLAGVKFILLTSYDLDDPRLKILPSGTEIIHKDADFAELLVDCLLKWGFFGELRQAHA